MGLSDSQIEQFQESFNTFDQDEEGNNTGMLCFFFASEANQQQLQTKTQDDGFCY